MPEFEVTPYEVKGDIDYQKLIEKFGTEPLTERLLSRLKKHAGELHFMLRRNVFFCHRDLKWLLDEHEKGNPFFLYTGRGPSGDTHLGHLMPWLFTRWLQEKFKVPLYFQLTDDEKFYVKDSLSLEQTQQMSLDNALDIIALGFKKGKTFLFRDTKAAGAMYPLAAKFAKRITTSTVKSSFGFTDSTNIGAMFYTSMQAVPAVMESVRQGKKVPCLIPLGVDQDPHFRVARDVCPRLGYPKPAIIHCRFLPALSGPGKMSASAAQHETIFTTDSPKDVKRKINKYAFSGGQATVEEHRRKGGNPDIDVSFQYLRMMFEPDDKKLEKIREEYQSGELLTGELKQILIEKVNAFLEKHQEAREKAKDKLDDFLCEGEKMSRRLG